MKLELKPERHYDRVHTWLRLKFGKTIKCEGLFCNGFSKSFDYALKNDLTHDYKRSNYLTLCKSCHRKYDFKKETRVKMSNSKKGELHPRSKLTQFQVNEIKSKYKFRVVTQKMLAKEYGVCEHTIHYILINRTWKN